MKSELNEVEFMEHLKSCETCAELFEKINDTLNTLDEKVEIPSGLTEQVVQKINWILVEPVRRNFDFNKYLQLAAVVVAGIFLGVLLGSRANPKLFLSKKDKKERALIEYRDSHHLNDQSTIFSF
ncbi:MAG: hypothetical protein WCJ95_22155 [Mariniphaga sp.]